MMTKEHKLHSRRTIVKNAMWLGMASPILPYVNLNIPKQEQKSGLELHVFSKHLQFLNYEEMAKKALEIGFDGVDLTVRPKGHVLPENVERDLPTAVAAIRKEGLMAKMMATRIDSAEDAETVSVLETATQQGIQFYRTGYYSYRKNHTIPEDIAHYQNQSVQLAALNKKLGITGCYQNHAGTRMGASIWELYQLLEKVENPFFGVQYDIRHAMVEGGLSWVNGLKLIQPMIRTLVLKDFKWEKVQGQWKLVNTPFGQGMVDFESYFRRLKEMEVNVPVSMHFEYELGGANHGTFDLKIDPQIVYDAMHRDLTRARKLWDSI